MVSKIKDETIGAILTCLKNWPYNIYLEIDNLHTHKVKYNYQQEMYLNNGYY